MGSLDYLKQYISINKINAHREALKEFLEMLYGIKGSLETNAERYLSNKRNWRADVQDFMVHTKDLSAKTQKFKVSAIKLFLLENGIKFVFLSPPSQVELGFE